MSKLEIESTARDLINKLLAGGVPNGITPNSLGAYGEAVQALYEAYDQGKTPAVRKAFESLSKADPKIAHLTAGELRKEFPVEIITAAQLGSLELPEPKYVVEGVLPEGVSVLAAAPKIGKSLLAQGISYAISSGGVALGCIPVNTSRVLYLALEGSKRGLKKRFVSMSMGEPLPENLHLAQTWPNKDEGGYEVIESWLAQNRDAGLIVVDTLKRIRGKGSRNNTLYDDDYDAIQPLTGLAEKWGVSVLLIHHTRKAEATDPLDLVSGSYGLTAAVDNILVMRRSRAVYEAELSVFPREEEEKSLALKFDKAIASWHLLGDSEEAALSKERRKILNLLRREGIAMSPSEIASKLDEDPNNIKQLLRKMKESGMLSKPSRGEYQIHPLK